MAKKRSIPQIPLGTDASTTAILGAVKENLEIIMGQRVEPIKPLSTAANQAEILAKVNEIIARLQ